MSAVAKSPDICSLIMCEPGSAEASDPGAGCWPCANTNDRQERASSATNLTVLCWYHLREMGSDLLPGAASPYSRVNKAA